jgi:hypothetical protein
MSLVSKGTLSVSAVRFEDAFDREPDAVWPLESTRGLPGVIARTPTSRPLPVSHTIEPPGESR